MLAGHTNMWWSKQHTYRKLLLEIIVIMMSILLLVYPLELNARDLVRIHHYGKQSSGVSSSSVRDSYNASRHDQALRESDERVEKARSSLNSARANQSRIQSQGPSSVSPNSHYRDLMDAQGEVYRAQSDLREENNRAYWEQRR